MKDLPEKIIYSYECFHCGNTKNSASIPIQWSADIKNDVCYCEECAPYHGTLPWKKGKNPKAKKIREPKSYVAKRVI